VAPGRDGGKRHAEVAGPFHFTPVGSSWMNQIETWFGISQPR
jgi:hypothetical protein